MVRRFNKRRFRKFKRNFKRAGGNPRKLRKFTKRAQTKVWRNSKRDRFAPKSFFRITQTIVVDVTNAGGGYLLDTVIKGNSLNTPYAVAADNYLGYPVWQASQLYKKYYIWKSEVKATYSDDLITSTAGTPLMKRIYLAPVVDSSTAFTTTNVNWATPGNTPEDFYRVKFKTWTSSSAVYKGPITIKNRAKTKTLYKTQPGVANEWWGTINPGGTISAPTVLTTNPVRLWYWHLWIMNADEVSAANNIKGRFLITTTYWCRFTEPNQTLNKAGAG